MRIRNAKLVGKTEVRVPSSKMKKVIAEQLVKNGYLADVKLEDAKPRGVLVITINEEGTNSTINEITRVSKPGRHVYQCLSTFHRAKLKYLRKLHLCPSHSISRVYHLNKA